MRKQYSYSRALRKQEFGDEAPFLSVSYAAARREAPFLTGFTYLLTRRASHAALKRATAEASCAGTWAPSSGASSTAAPSAVGSSATSTFTTRSTTRRCQRCCSSPSTEARTRAAGCCWSQWRQRRTRMHELSVCVTCKQSLGEVGGEAPFLRGFGAKVKATFLMSRFLNARE